jgi:hypothetical protein
MERSWFSSSAVVSVFPEYQFQQGDWSRFAYPVQRSSGNSVDEWSDQPLVPADLGMDVVDIACKIILLTLTFLLMATGQAKNRQVNSTFISFLHCCRNLEFSTVNRGRMSCIRTS